MEVGPGPVKLAVHVLDSMAAATAALGDADSAAPAIAELAATAGAASGAAPPDAEQRAAQGLCPPGTLFRCFSDRHPGSWLPVPQLYVLAQRILGTHCTTGAWQQRLNIFGMRLADPEERRLFKAFHLLPAVSRFSMISTEAFADFLSHQPKNKNHFMSLAAREPAKLLAAWFRGQCEHPTLGNTTAPPAAAADATPAGGIMHTSLCSAVVLAAQPLVENIRHDHTIDCLRIYAAFPTAINTMVCIRVASAFQRHMQSCMPPLLAGG